MSISKEPRPVTTGVLVGLIWPDRHDYISEDKSFEIIPNQISIRYLNEKDKKHKLWVQPRVPEDHLMVLEVINNSQAPQEDITCLKNMLLSFRLLKEGDIFIPNIYQLQASSRSRSDVNIPMIVKEYILNSSEIKRLQEIYFSILKLNSKMSDIASLVIFRFNNSYNTNSMENQLIDLCISTEALFLRGEYNKTEQGMGQLIGLASSMLLGDDDNERMEITTTMEEVYKIRNKIMHGNRYNGRDLVNSFPSFNKYIRKAILKIIFEV